MNKVRVLIVDDEARARERLHELLVGHAEIELLNDCTDRDETVTAIQEKVPDLIFLDVGTPELDGFTIVQTIHADPKPVVVFTTEHEHFALRAFEIGAVDYLLKPVTRERVELALQRALEQIRYRRQRSASNGPAVSPSLRSLPARTEAINHPSSADRVNVQERVAIKTGTRITILRAADILWIHSGHNYIEIHTAKQSHLVRQAMAAIEKRLPSEIFVRISRSVIVNLQYVMELEPLLYGAYTVTLQNQMRLTLSRRYRAKLPLFGVRA